MKSAKDRIEEIRRNGYELDFGYTFNLAFETYKQCALIAGVVVLLFCIVMAVFFATVMGGLIGMSALGESMTNFNPANFSGLYVTLYIIGTAAFSGLMSPFTAGLVKLAHNAHRNEEISMGTVFNYYKGDYFVQLFIAGFIIALFSGGLSTLLQMNDYIFSGSIVSLLISFFSMFAIPIIILGDLKAFDAIRGSFILVFRRPFIILLLMLVAYLLALFGLLAFCIGIFFTLPFMTCMIYSIYAHSVGTIEEDTIDEIGRE